MTSETQAKADAYDELVRTAYKEGHVKLMVYGRDADNVVIYWGTPETSVSHSAFTTVGLAEKIREARDEST